ncbi:hypothetical protein CU098_013246 [Rhizopus stolonifer]|uniref:SAP domain-containing protein n=1 Tax=Rhizopus stolonifer TaxID=4846 RepID=A0A367KV10_RHIST|nr:hypothetical protein CU098_013246 [Rhizopus stolonifer]
MTNLSSLKVTQLRDELSKRGIQGKGKKAELIERLQEALDLEKTQESASNNEEPRPDLEATSVTETGDSVGKTEAKEVVEEPTKEATEEPIKETAEESTKEINEKSIKEAIEDPGRETVEEPVKEAFEEPAKETDKEPIKEAKKVEETKEEAEKVTKKEDQKEPNQPEITKEGKPIEQKTEEKQDNIATNKGKESIKENIETLTDIPVNNEPHVPNPMDVDTERGLKRGLSTEPEKFTEEKRAKLEDQKGQTNDNSAILVRGFVRPLILRQAQELFSKYGNVKKFWMDSIKTHCYVIYETSEEAQKAYSQVNGIIFPSETGRKLTVEDVTPVQAESLIEYEQSAAEQRLRINWEDIVSKVKSGEELPSSPASDVRRSRSLGIGQIAKQLAQAASPVEKSANTGSEKVREEKRGVSLDDLFRKTKTVPHLYYLPVSDEEAKAKANQIKNLT